eukprot:TRINITY_DN4_c0_g1_i1.p2 TRINITY_DN4_c0_g1~~TRINITY_DN4_c0_g1_i1.p2  ORF type:complete len:224 (+),score=48.64 TRINITY_DN4_c0_g1_i1:717-1388(+)
MFSLTESCRDLVNAVSDAPVDPASQAAPSLVDQPPVVDSVPSAAEPKDDPNTAAPATASETATTTPVAEQVPPEKEQIDYDEYLRRKAEKQKELEAKLGAPKEKRSLTDEELKNLQNFTLVENSKAKKPVKEAKPRENSPATANTAARKGEKPLAVQDVIRIRKQPQERGPNRGYGNNFGDRKPENTGDRFAGQKNNANPPEPAHKPRQKIIRDDSQFPLLSQ